MSNGFDFGPFIDPVLLDFCMKLGIIGGIVVLIVMVFMLMKRVKVGFEDITYEPIEQIEELKRQVAMHVAEAEGCKQEIGRLKREAGERGDEYRELMSKYVSLLEQVDDLEERISLVPQIGKISVPVMRAPQMAPEISRVNREPTLPPPNPKSLKMPALRRENTPTAKVVTVPRPIPREDK